MRLVLLGAPGSGKSTQAKLLAEQLSIPQISTTDLLNTAVEVQTPLGRQAIAILSTGQHLPNELVFGMIRERLSNPDALNGFILDGFPHNIEQTNELDTLLNSLNMPIQKAIIINTNPDILSSRLHNRLVCEDCGEIFNRLSKPTIMGQQCSKCEGPLQDAADDTEDSFEQRMLSYKSQIQAIMNFYNQQNKLATVDGNGDIKSTYHSMKLIFKSILLSSSIKKPTVNTTTSPKASSSPIARAVTKAKAPVQRTMNFTSDSTKSPLITSNSEQDKISHEKTLTTPKLTTPPKEIKNSSHAKSTSPENTEIITPATDKTKKTSSVTKKATTDEAIKTIEKPKPETVKAAKQKTAAKKKSVTKKTATKKAKKQDDNNLQAQLKWLKAELKQVKTETTQTEKRNQKLMKLTIESDLIRKQFSAKWEKDIIKMLKGIK